MATQKKTEAPENQAEQIAVKNPLYAAIVNVMREVKSIEKNLTVGEGKASYKGVADKDVKHYIGEAMSRNGLSILPIEITPKVSIERWTEDTNYGPKTKQSVFTEVQTKYLLIHESGESIEIVGYGHGVDSQDKSAGKATTYALKYALLYAFMVPTGSIDDTDAKHSNDTETAPENKTVQPTNIKKQGLTDAQFNRAINKIELGEYSKEELTADYFLTPEQVQKLKTV
jgi:hypothetical protein